MPKTKRQVEERLEEVESELENIYDQIGDLLGIEEVDEEDEPENGKD